MPTPPTPRTSNICGDWRDMKDLSIAEIGKQIRVKDSRIDVLGILATFEVDTDAYDMHPSDRSTIRINEIRLNIRRIGVIVPGANAVWRTES